VTDRTGDNRNGQYRSLFITKLSRIDNIRRAHHWWIYRLSIIRNPRARHDKRTLAESQGARQGQRRINRVKVSDPESDVVGVGPKVDIKEALDYFHEGVELIFGER
jgi:hypothetical protein